MGFKTISTNKYSSARLNSTNLIPTSVLLQKPPTVEYLVVAGGGGGSGANGGGGGAGGYRTATGFAITSSTPITVTVGAGGAQNTVGASSVFGSISTVGGGSGNGGAGGSGGGHGNGGGSGGTATAGQGNIGGAAPGGQSNGAAGGGGAGGSGFANSSSNGGAGGAGLYSSISGTSTAYAGGGGGSGGNGAGTTSGAGGSGGGGAGGYGTSETWNGVAGTANTGGGGGGGGGRSGVGNGNGSEGGSGIVILRYLTTYAAAKNITGSPTITIEGSYRVYKFTSSGSITFTEDTVAPTWPLMYTANGTFSTNLAAYSTYSALTYSLYSGTLPAGLALSSTGIISGTVTASVGTYTCVVSATDSAYQYGIQPLRFTVSVLVTSTVEYLVVAGGGGGGAAVGGGGGGGGFLTTSGYTVSAGTSYTVTVGAGGAGSTSQNSLGSAGNNSIFNNITAIGGGGGQSNQNATVTTGGSGGGSATTGASNTTPGNGTAGQGNNGGTRTVSGPAYGSGGGGGAGAIGGAGSGTAGGAGGDGAVSNIDVVNAITNSVLFNGTSDYLTAPSNAAFAFGTGDFTVEAWIRKTGGSGNLPICQSDALGSSTNDKWWFALVSGGLFFGTHNAGGFNVVTTSSFTLNTWYHVAVTRASGVMKLFINGVSTAFTTTGTPSGYSLSQNGFTIGAMSTPSYWTGAISNLRVVKGTAVYTATFTPSYQTLAAITNTSLLTVQSSTIVDNSTNAFTITKVSNPTVSSAVIPISPTTYYAGGGGGGTYNGASGQGAGGLGGGGAAVMTTGVSGTINTGGGGGGGGISDGSPGVGGAGGTGIVIIRYADTYAAATSTTGSPTITVSGGYRVYKWTSSGTITF